MDLHTAVAMSMLPVSRSRACATFRDLRQQDPHITVAHVLDALRIPPDDRTRIEDEVAAAR